MPEWRCNKNKDLTSVRSLNSFDKEEMKEIVRACFEHEDDNDRCLSSFECPADSLHEPEGKIDYSHIAEDDVSGETPDTKMVRAARKEEIAYFRSMGLYTKVPIQECYDETGKNPVGVR